MGGGPPCCLGLCPRCCYTTCKGPLLKVVAVLALVISCVWAYTWPGLYTYPDALFSPYYMLAMIPMVVLPCLCFAGGGAACAGVCAEERAKSDQAGCRGLCFSGCSNSWAPRAGRRLRPGRPMAMQKNKWDIPGLGDQEKKHRSQPFPCAPPPN